MFHMIFSVYTCGWGLYDLVFLTCVCIQGDFAATYYMYVIFKRVELLYIRGINFKVMHTRGSQF